MKLRSIAATFLIWLWLCSVALVPGQCEAPEDGATSHDAIERGMLLDAWQRRQRHRGLYPLHEKSTITGSTIHWNAEGLLNLTRQQQAMDHPAALFRTNGEIFSLPCFDEGYLYFGACDGIFYCVNKKTGAVRWRKKGFDRVDSAPTLHEGKVFFAASGDILYALKSDSGEVAWKAKVPGGGYQNPKLLNKMVYLTGEGQLLGFDPSSGKVHRRYPFSGDGGDFSWNSKVIVVAVSRDVASKDYTGKGSVVCFDRDTAEPRWTTVLGGACLGTLACDEDNCYLGTRDGFFYTIRIADGKIAWRIDCRRLFPEQGSKNQSLQAALEKEIEPVWPDGHVIDVGTHVAFSAAHPLITAPSVLALADKRTGKLVWVVPHPTQISGRFLAVDGILMAIAEDRKMLLVSIADGKSVSVSLLPAVPGKGFCSGQPRGEFAGVTLDQGELFIVGADTHVWRLPLGSVKGTLNWPIAQPPNTPQPQRRE